MIPYFFVIDYGDKCAAIKFDKMLCLHLSLKQF